MTYVDWFLDGFAHVQEGERAGELAQVREANDEAVLLPEHWPGAHDGRLWELFSDGNFSESLGRINSCFSPSGGQHTLGLRSSSKLAMPKVAARTAAFLLISPYLGFQVSRTRVNIGAEGRHMDEPFNTRSFGSLCKVSGSLDMDVVVEIVPSEIRTPIENSEARG